ncbi:hypothetical protein NECID01_1690 [Nematocida sp. AWRm77]|nr:hypothetical protein NECID01_1690 [Nematocida sp. AWRm77]
MKRIVFGKRAIKKPKVEQREIKYSPGSIVLGYFYKENLQALSFKLPNGRTGLCIKEYIAAEMEECAKNMGDTGKKKVFVKEFKKDLFVELLILGESSGKYECTFFIPKAPKLYTLMSGFIEQKEETGYTVQTGLSNTKAFLKTQKEYCLGDLSVFQVRTVNEAMIVLGDVVDREIYIGEKSEIYPGVLLKATITGRPRYIANERQPTFTKLPCMYTANTLGICNTMIESRQELEADTDVDAIIIYVSEDRSTVHAVPYSDWLALTSEHLPDPALVGQEFLGTVKEIMDRHTLVCVENGEHSIQGFLLSRHYSDISAEESSPMFEKDTTIKVKVFAVDGYTITFTAKESLFGEPVPSLKNKDVVKCVVKTLTDKGLVCEILGGALVTVKKFEDEGTYIGKLLDIQIIKKGIVPGMYIGRRFTKDTLQKPEGKKASRFYSKLSPEAKLELAKQDLQKFSNGQIAEGKIEKIYQYGAFVRLTPHLEARMKIKEISMRFVQDWQSLLHTGQIVKVVLSEIDYENVRVEASIKKYEVLNMMGALPEEEVEEPLPVTALPIAYTEEALEEMSEEELSEEDEEFQMELFNSKNKADPYVKRILSYPVEKAVSIWRKAMETEISPESKKQLCVSVVTAIGKCSKSPACDVESIIKEGIKRDSTAFLKKCIDNTRHSANTPLYKTLCTWFTKEKKESLFGYRELLFLAQRTKDQSILDEVRSLIAASPLKSADRKEADILWVETLYQISKTEARTAIEKTVASPETKGRIDWILKYLSLEISTISTSPDVLYVRNLFTRFVSLQDLSTSSAKGMFKMYLTFEKEYGTKDTEKKVLEMAKTYIAQIDSEKATS